MGHRTNLQSHYFQEIARAFFALGGAPFVLSSQDLVTIASWEELRIPLEIVTAGIQNAFQSYRRHSTRKGKMPSLSFCNREVLRAFAQHKERKTGRKRAGVSRESKRQTVRREVKRFLAALPAEVDYLKDVYKIALRLLSQKHASEEELEKLDDQVESMILRFAPETAKEAVAKQVTEIKTRTRQEREDIMAVQLVKLMRQKHRIPPLSFFYY